MMRSMWRGLMNLRSAAEPYGMLALATALIMFSFWLAAQVRSMRHCYPIAIVSGLIFGEIFVGTFWRKF
jgi:hypothetical protein